MQGQVEPDRDGIMTRWDKWVVSIIVALLVTLGAQASSTVIEGAFEDCTWEWRPWAMNASAWDKPDQFYEISHGYSRAFYPYCGRDMVTPEDIAVGGYKLGFFASCSGLCSTADGTFAESVDEAVGYCGMDEACCVGCWPQSVAWQDTFYRERSYGAEAQAAFDAAMNAVPACLPCLRYHKKRAPEQVNETQVVLATVIIPWLMRERQ